MNYAESLNYLEGQKKFDVGRAHAEHHTPVGVYKISVRR